MTDTAASRSATNPSAPSSNSPTGYLQRPLSQLEAGRTIPAAPGKRPMPPPPLPRTLSTTIPDPELPQASGSDANPNPTAASASLRPRKRRRVLLQMLVTALVGVTLTGVSLAALSPSVAHKSQQASAAATRAPARGPKGHASAPKPNAHSAARPATRLAALATTPKSKHPEAQHETQRKMPVNARVAAKSKAPKRAHQNSKPAKLAAKSPKPVA
jgi:hypothetical protein